MPIIIIIATMDLGGIILTESTLSYLGVGISFPYASWGNMVYAVTNTTILRNFPNIWVPPGICILLTVLAFNFIGDGLRDAYDPKMKR
jgi:peptide/nickel transport system permease protein